MELSARQRDPAQLVDLRIASIAALHGQSRQWIDSLISGSTVAGAVATVGCAPLIATAGALSSTGGAAVFTSGLAALGPGGMMGGIGCLGMIGGSCGVALVASLVRKEQSKVKWTTIAASAGGALVGCGVSCGAVLAASATGTAGAAAVTSGLAALGGGALAAGGLGIAGGVMACTGIGLGVALAFGLLAFALWYLRKETSFNFHVPNDPTQALFLDTLAAKVEFRDLEHDEPLTDPAQRKRHVEEILKAAKSAPNHLLTDPAQRKKHIAEILTAAKGSLKPGRVIDIGILAHIHAEFAQEKDAKPWRSWFKGITPTYIDDVLRLLIWQILMARVLEEDENHEKLLEVCATLTDQGRRKFGVPFALLLNSTIQAFSRQSEEIIHAIEIQFARQVFRTNADSSKSEIEREWRKLSRLTHPDKNNPDLREDFDYMQKCLNELKDLLVSLKQSGLPLPLADGSVAEMAEKQVNQAAQEGETPIVWVQRVKESLHDLKKMLPEKAQLQATLHARIWGIVFGSFAVHIEPRSRAHLMRHWSG